MNPESITLEDLDKFYLFDEDSHNRRIAVRLGLNCTLYMRNPHSAEVRSGLAKCADQYLELVGDNIKSGFNSITGGAVAPYLPGQINFSQALAAYDDVEKHHLMAEYYGDADPYVATHFGLSLSASSKKASPLRDRPAFFRATLPFSWLKDKSGEGAFQKLVHNWCTILKPYHGYAGIGALQSMDLTENERTVLLAYPYAKRFPGLEIDEPSAVASMAKKSGPPLKIKGVNWLTAVDDECMAELGGREAFLGDLGEGFKIFEYEGGVLIQAGVIPQLGDRNRQLIPILYQQLARKLKPLRMKFPNGWSLLKSPNRQEQSHADATNEWLARFD
jgi:hypothetical protein